MQSLTVQEIPSVHTVVFYWIYFVFFGATPLLKDDKTSQFCPAVQWNQLDSNSDEWHFICVTPQIKTLSLWKRACLKQLALKLHCS